MLAAPAQQRVFAVGLGQLYPPAVGGGLEDGHQGLHHPQGVGAAAFVVAVPVQGPDVLLHEAVVVLGGPGVGIVVPGQDGLQRFPAVVLAVGNQVGGGQAPGAGAPPQQAALGAEEFHHRGRQGLRSRQPLLQQGGGDVAGEFEDRGDILAGDDPHSGGRGQNVLRCQRTPVGQPHRRDGAAGSGEFLHDVDLVGADVHHPEAPVVPLVPGVDVEQVADLSFLVGPVRRLQPGVEAVLVMDRYAHSFLPGPGDHLVGLFEVDAQRFLDVDVDPVLQHSHGQVEMEFGAGGDGDYVRRGGLDHRVEVGKARSHPQFISQALQAFADEIAQARHLGAGVGVVGARGGGAAGAATENGHSVCPHGFTPVVGDLLEVCRRRRGGRRLRGGAGVVIFLFRRRGVAQSG